MNGSRCGRRRVQRSFEAAQFLSFLYIGEKKVKFEPFFPPSPPPFSLRRIWWDPPCCGKGEKRKRILYVRGGGRKKRSRFKWKEPNIFPGKNYDAFSFSLPKKSVVKVRDTNRISSFKKIFKMQKILARNSKILCTRTSLGAQNVFPLPHLPPASSHRSAAAT